MALPPDADADCPREAEAASYVMGELSGAEAADFERHLEGCAGCRAFVDEAQPIVAELRPAPRSPNLEAQLASRILDAARRRQRWRWCKPALAAAIVLAFVAGGLWHELAAPHADLGAAQWLAAGLGSEGTWEAAPRVGLHALAMLALAAAGEADALDQAALRLLDEQGEDGSFGLSGAAPTFDDALAALALVESSRLTGSAEQRRGAERALAALAARQLPDGGFVVGPDTNTALTAACVRALARGRELGVRSLEDAIALGRARLRHDLGRLDDPGPTELLALGLDAPRAAPALRAATPPSGELYTRALAVIAP